jgi:hypothetical protein
MTSFDPMRPLPPITTIFIIVSFIFAPQEASEHSLFHYLRCGLRQWSEAGTKFFGEELRLLPGGEVTALGKLVVVDELGICPLRPTARCLEELVRKGARGHGDLDALRRALRKSP